MQSRLLWCGPASLHPHHTTPWLERAPLVFAGVARGKHCRAGVQRPARGRAEQGQKRASCEAALLGAQPAGTNNPTACLPARLPACPSTHTARPALATDVVCCSIASCTLALQDRKKEAEAAGMDQGSMVGGPAARPPAGLVVWLVESGQSKVLKEMSVGLRASLIDWF